MAKKAYFGVSGKARNIKNIYIGVGGKARKVKKAYIGVGGKARLFYQSTLAPNIVRLWNDTQYTASVNAVAYGNGYWVVGGTYTNGATSYGVIAYTNNLDGNWTTKVIFDGGEVNCITYKNGYFVIGGHYTLTTVHHAAIAYTTNPSGTWNTTDIWGYEDTDNEIYCIYYDDGYWVVGGQLNDSGRYSTIAYSTSLSTGWKLNKLYSNGSRKGGVHAIIHTSKYWIAYFRYQTSSNVFTYVAYSTTLTTSKFSTKSIMTGKTPTGIAYANGYYVISTEQNGGILYTTDPIGTWKSLDIKYDQYVKFYNVVYSDGHWVVCGTDRSSTGNSHYGMIAYTTDIEGTWTIKHVWDSNNAVTKTAPINDIVRGDEYWLAGGKFYVHEGTITYGQIAYSPTLELFDQIQ